MPNSDRYTIGVIQASLGFKITGEFIVDTLGVEPVERDKRAQFFTAEQFDVIKKKLSYHCRDAELVRAEKAQKKTAAPAPSFPDLPVDCLPRLELLDRHWSLLLLRWRDCR